jgi:EpsG family
MKLRSQNTSNLSVIYGWLILLIWPFGMLLMSMRNFNNKRYRFFIILFFVFYGFTFIANGGDSFEHKELFDEISKKPISELYIILTDFVHLRGDELDVYASLVNFFISRFTNNSAYVFAFHALVFGFFYLKSISFLYDEFKGKINKNALLFLFMFITLFSIHQISSVRYYTAMWIWIYGALHLLSKKKLKYIAWCLLASLVHFGITPATAILLIFYLLGPRNKIYIPLVFISFIVGNLFPPAFLVQLGTSINSTAEARAESYTNADVQAVRTEGIRQAAWFIQLRVDVLQYYLLFALAYIRFKGKEFKWDIKQEYLFSFLMLYLSFVNFVISVASLGGRMRFIFWAMAAYFFYRFFQLNRSKKMLYITMAGLFPIFLWAAVEFRINSEFTNVLAVVGNPFLLLLDKTDISVYDVIFKK